MEKTGYCWIPYIVDCGSSQFNEDVSGVVQLFRPSSIVTTHSARFRSVLSLRDMQEWVDQVGKRLMMTQERLSQQILVHLLVHIILRSFRWTFWKKLSLLGQKKHEDELDADKLCYEDVMRVAGGSVVMVTGNRAKIKTTTGASGLFELLFGGLDDPPPTGGKRHPRQHWHHIGFRQLCVSATDWVRDNWTTAPSDGPVGSFRRMLCDELCAHYWILPYLDMANGAFTSTASKEKRQAKPAAALLHQVPIRRSNREDVKQRQTMGLGHK